MFTEVDDGGATETEINFAYRTAVSSKSGHHTIPAENAHGRWKDQTSSGLNQITFIAAELQHEPMKANLLLKS